MVLTPSLKDFRRLLRCLVSEQPSVDRVYPLSRLSSAVTVTASSVQLRQITAAKRGSLFAVPPTPATIKRRVQDHERRSPSASVSNLRITHDVCNARGSVMAAGHAASGWTGCSAAGRDRRAAAAAGGIYGRVSFVAVRLSHVAC